MKVELKGKINDSFEPFFSSHERDLFSYGGAGAGKSKKEAEQRAAKRTLQKLQLSLRGKDDGSREESI